MHVPPQPLERRALAVPGRPGGPEQPVHGSDEQVGHQRAVPLGPRRLQRGDLPAGVGHRRDALQQQAGGVDFAARPGEGLLVEGAAGPGHARALGAQPVLRVRRPVREGALGRAEHRQAEEQPVHGGERDARSGPAGTGTAVGGGTTGHQVVDREGHLRRHVEVVDGERVAAAGPHADVGPGPLDGVGGARYGEDPPLGRRVRGLGQAQHERPVGVLDGADVRPGSGQLPAAVRRQGPAARRDRADDQGVRAVLPDAPTALLGQESGHPGEAEGDGGAPGGGRTGRPDRGDRAGEGAEAARVAPVGDGHEVAGEAGVEQRPYDVRVQRPGRFGRFGTVGREGAHCACGEGRFGR